MAQPKRPTPYLRNADLIPAIIESKQQGKMTDKLARMLMLLCKRYATRPQFVGYPFRDDMEGVALMALVKTWASFDETRWKNPFAYYSKCIHNSFIQYIKLEKSQHRLKDHIRVANDMLPSYSFQLDHCRPNDDEADFELHLQEAEILQQLPTEEEVVKQINDDVDDDVLTEEDFVDPIDTEN